LYTDQGNAVTRGQLLARLDDTLLQTAVTQAEAELASRESEVARARTLVSNARTQVEQARLEQQQTQNDTARFQKLLSAGAISQQQAELSQTAAGTAAQAVRAAQEQVRTEQQAVAAAESRVIAQRAVIAQSRERRSYALVTAPITGIVLEKFTEPGNLVSAGSEVLKIGDFSRAKVVVQVSELEVSKIRVGQSVQVRLDAFPQAELTGQVTHISPSADPTARVLPIEITIPNTDGRIGSGLLARVRFSQQSNQRVVVPQTALRAGEPRGREGQSQREGQTTANRQAKLFVVLGEGQNAKVAAKQVTLGDRANNQVEVLSGLQPGERLVIRSGKPLKDGETVRLSVLSESSSNRQNQQSKTQNPE
jgi:RND family efflux transporter MFP subunit